jgi:signal transduction histidine kinase/CheY-like chemotaxis protein
MELNETALHDLGEIARWGVFSTDVDLLITGWSRWMELHSGVTAGQALGRNLIDLFPEVAARKTDRFYHQALAGQMVLMSQRLHGYIIPLPSTIPLDDVPLMRQSGHIAPLRKDGAIVGTLTLIEDVSERLAYETELRSLAAQQEAVAALAQTGLAGGDIAPLLQRVVRSVMEVLHADYCRILEFPRQADAVTLRAEEGTGAGRWGSSPPESAHLARAGFLRSSTEPTRFGDSSGNRTSALPADLAAEDMICGIEVPIQIGSHFRGSLGVYASRPRTFNDDNVQFLQAVVNVLGMAAQRKSLELELRSHVDQLAEADRRKDEFLAMLAHELRNPLAPIRNAAILLGADSLDRESELEARAIIGRQVDHMVRLVDDLLDVSRILRGKIELKIEPVELTSVINRAIETSQPLIHAHEHQLTLALPSEPVWLNGDAVRLAQALSNLLNNAAKYTDRNGRLRIAAQRDAQDVAIRIEDNGMGIEPDFLPHIFDVFMQADRSIARSQGGLGIGLTLVRSLIELHGGTVTAHSEGLGTGSTFTVRLPVISLAERPSHVEFRPAEVRRLRVLVVDDNVGSARILAALLTKFWGHDVHMAFNGNDAVEAALQFRPELILLDIGLPGMSGYEVASHLRRHPEFDTTILAALTGYGQLEDRRKSHEAGFDEHLVKPTSVHDLQRLFAHPKLAQG